MYCKISGPKISQANSTASASASNKVFVSLVMIDMAVSTSLCLTYYADSRRLSRYFINNINALWCFSYVNYNFHMKVAEYQETLLMFLILFAL